MEREHDEGAGLVQVWGGASDAAELLRVQKLPTAPRTRAEPKPVPKPRPQIRHAAGSPEAIRLVRGFIDQANRNGDRDE